MKLKLLTFLTPLLLVLLFAGCSGDADSFAEALLAQENDVAGISVATSRELMSVGETQTLTSAAQSASGADDFAWDDVTWRVSDTQLATISGIGVLSALSPGSVEVTAEYAGYTGSALVEIDNSSLQSISVSPTGDVDVCRSVALTATGNYGEGDDRNISDLVNWSTTATAGLTLGELESNQQMISTTVAGEYQVVAGYGGVTGNAIISALDGNLVSISITPVSSTISTDETQQYVAQAEYQTVTLTPPAAPGSSSDVVADTLTETITTHADWAVADTSIASIDADGLLTASQSGSTTVTASCGGKTSNGSSLLVDDEVTVTSIEIRVGGTAKTYHTASLSDDETVSLSLYAEYSDGSDAVDLTEDSGTSWEIKTDTDLASIDNSGTDKGLVTLEETGSVTIHVEYGDFQTALQLVIED